MPTHSLLRCTQPAHARGTLVIIPGVNSGAYLFAGAIAQLGAHWHLLFINPPGVAGAPMRLPFSVRSYARTVLEIIRKHAPAGPLAVMGHSLGSFCAQEVARTLHTNPPEHAATPLTHLILVSSSPGQPFTTQDVTSLQQHSGKSFWQTMRGIEQEPATGMKLFFGSWPDSHPHEYRQFLQERHANLPGPAASLSQLTAGGLFTSQAWAGTLAVHTLCVHGMADVLVSPTGGQALASLLPQARWLAYHNVGHFPMLEHPHFYRHLAEFLDEPASAPVNTARRKPLFQRLRESFFAGAQQQAALSLEMMFLPVTTNLAFQQRMRKVATHV